MMKSQNASFSPSSCKAIAAQLAPILSSPDFTATPQQAKLLKYVVGQTLDGKADRIKGYTVATEVFGRRSDFDQSIDPIVSIQAAGLRRALKHYYQKAGRHDSLKIDIPKGTYVPTFSEKSTKVQTTNTASVRNFWPAVLIQPLHNITGDPALDFWGLGLASEIAHELDRYPDIRVITAITGKPGTAAEPPDVQFKIDGNVLSDGTFIKITLWLTEALTGRQIWCDSYRSTIDAARLIDFQEKIAQVATVKIAGEHGLISKAVGSGWKRRPQEKMELYGALLHYYDFNLTYTPQAFSRALASLEKAIVVDPGCGQLWSAKARLYAISYALDIPGFDHPLDQAYAFAQNGLRFSPDDQRSHATMAYVHLLCNDLEAGRAEAERALALGPETLFVLDDVGYMMTLLGEWERGAALIERVIRLNPFYSNFVHYGLWLNCLRQEDYNGAYTETLKLNHPAFFWDHLARAATLGLIGNIEEGRKSAAELLRLKPDFHERGRDLIRHYIKFEDIAERVVEGLAAVGINIREAELIS